MSSKVLMGYVYASILLKKHFIQLLSHSLLKRVELSYRNVLMTFRVYAILKEYWLNSTNCQQATPDSKLCWMNGAYLLRCMYDVNDPARHQYLRVKLSELVVGAAG